LALIFRKLRFKLRFKLRASKRGAEGAHFAFGDVVEVPRQQSDVIGRAGPREPLALDLHLPIILPAATRWMQCENSEHV
jgi:hypothetical protein